MLTKEQKQKLLAYLTALEKENIACLKTMRKQGKLITDELKLQLSSNFLLH